jgi:hypothetical protein
VGTVKFNDVGFLSPDLSVWAEEVRNEFNSSFELAERINRLGMQLLFEIPTENINDQQALATASYGRAIQLFQVALLLAERGALAEARAIVRLSAEAVIAVGALKTDPLMPDQFREDYDHHRRTLVNALLEGVEGEKADSAKETRLRAVLAEVDRSYGQRKPRPINWDRSARRAGLKGLYDMVYRLASGNAAHVNLGSLNRHIIPDSNYQLAGFKFHPDKTDLRSTLFAANASMLHLLGLMVDWFPLARFQDELRACIDRWKEIEPDEPL